MTTASLYTLGGAPCSLAELAALDRLTPAETEQLEAQLQRVGWALLWDGRRVERARPAGDENTA